MWRLRHLIVVGSIAALAYYFSISFQADWKVLTVIGGLLALVYFAANLADPAVPPEPQGDPEETPEPPRET